MKMLSEALVETQELADAKSGEQERNGETGGVHGKEQNSARDGIAGGGERKHRRKNWSDARCPAKRERETEEEAAPDPGLRAAGAQADVAVQPSRHHWSEEADQGKREEMNGAQSGEEWSAAEKRDGSYDHAATTENEAGAHGEFDQYPEQVQSEEQDERARDG